MSTVESIEGGQYDGLSDGELARANEEIDALMRRQREHTCDA